MHQRRRHLGSAASGALQIIPHVLPLVVRQIFIPSAGRGIVVGAGVHDGVGNVVVGKVRVIGIAVEGELQDPRPRQVELVAERGTRPA